MKRNFLQVSKNDYRQIFGTPMGSPISPLLADIVMQDLELTILQSLNFKVHIYFCYVNDTFFIIPSDELEYILRKFNSHDP